MLIGLAGVTSTGKTTLAGAIQDEFGFRVVILNKISRQEIYDFTGFDNLTDKDLYRLSNEHRAKFDVGRCMLQMRREEDASLEPIDSFKFKAPAVIVDGCAIVKAAYMIYLSGQFMKPDVLDNMVHQVLEHCVKTYKSIFFLPVTRMPFTVADHRYFSAEWVRKGQDAILWRLLFRELGTKIPIGLYVMLFSMI